MANYFTEKGLEIRNRKIKAHEEKVRAIGRETGEEAGISCDWHDNFGYEDAKRRLELESTTLKKLKEEASGVRLLTVQEQSDKVAIGVTVRLHVGSESKEYTIGAFGESDPSNGLITYNSPLGKALLGMKQGDLKTAAIGGKTAEIEIDEILPPSHRYHRLIAQLTDDKVPSI